MPGSLDQQQQFLGTGAPAKKAFQITPNDGIDLTVHTRGIYVGGAGDVRVTTTDGDTVTFVGMLAGSVYPIRCKRVQATGTTATNLIGLA